MAEPIGIASGVLALAQFAFQSTITLYETVQSFQNHPKRVRDLEQEVESLNTVLASLNDTIKSTKAIDLSRLDLPLLRCGNACKEFEAELLRCCSRSGSNRTSFRDWAKLQYMGENIDGFRSLLAGYKSTINIALTDANLRVSSVTAESLDDYRVLIKSATEDIEEHLQNIDERLNDFLGHATTVSDADTAELRLIKEERLSAQRSLEICAQLSQHIDQLQASSRRSHSSSAPSASDGLSERYFNDGLDQCKDSLAAAAAKIESHMRTLMERVVKKSKSTMTSEDDISDLARLQEEWDTARQCLEICSRANNHLKENVSMIDNYAIGDAVQFLVSTNGTIIHGKNRGMGWRTRQIGGHLSDESVQQLSQDIARMHLQRNGEERSEAKGDQTSGKNDELDKGIASEFKERYGDGFRLANKSSSDINVQSKPHVERGSSPLKR